MEQQRERIEYIDALKGFAILCVVLGHVLNGYISSALWPELNAEFRYIYNVVYAFHMPLFFSISGYLYSLAYFDNEKRVKSQKIKAHLIDFLCIYLIFNVLMWGFKLLAAEGVNKQVEVTDILMIWAKPIAIYWYLYVLMVLYVVFIPIIQKRVNSSVVFTILAILCIGSDFIGGHLWFQVIHTLYYAFFFWFGVYYHTHKSFILTRNYGAWISFLVSVVLMCLYWNSETYFNMIPIVNAIIALGIVSMSWYAFEKLLRGGGGLLSLCGKYCLEIYLIHVFVGSGMRIFGLGTKLLAGMPILCIVVNVLLSTIIPIFCAIVLKRLNIYQPLFRPYEYFSNRT